MTDDPPPDQGPPILIPDGIEAPKPEPPAAPAPPTGATEEGDIPAARAAAAAVVDRPKSEVDSTGDAAERQKGRGQKKDADTNRRLRLAYAIIILLIMGGQIGIADWVFYLYGEANRWEIPGGVISAWLGATVIEVIGVVVVIARFLFSEQSSA